MYSPKSFGSHEILSVNPNSRTHSTHPTFKNFLQKFPIPANLIHTYYVGSHVYFSSVESVVSYSPKSPSCKPKNRDP